MYMRAFTFIEVILVISLVVIIGVSTTWFSLHFLSDRQMILATDILEARLNQAHLYALAGKADTAWGITQQGTSLVLFAGHSYVDRSPQWDEVWDLPRGTTFSGMNEVIFEKTTGLTEDKSFVLHGATQMISGSVNQEGTIQWYE